METSQLFSSNSSEMRRFIFNRLQQTDNQKTLYTLRLISKSEQERVEKKIQTAKLNFCDIEKFATSQFSARIKFLEVCFRVWQDSFQSFKYLSNTYLPYALNINAKVYIEEGEEMDFEMFEMFEMSSQTALPLKMKLEMPEPLTFRRLHIVNYGLIYRIEITGKYNVEIRDCEFTGIGVYCENNANVYVTGSKFIKSPYFTSGLFITTCDSVHIDKITCRLSQLDVYRVKEVINITNVCFFSCIYGIVIGSNVAKFKMSNTIIKDCEIGIRVRNSCVQIQKTNIEGCRDVGIKLSHGAIVHYAAVEFKRNMEDVLIRDDDCQFVQLENIQ